MAPGHFACIVCFRFIISSVESNQVMPGILPPTG